MDLQIIKLFEDIIQPCMAIVNCLAIETNFDEKKISAPIWSGRLKEEKVSHSSLTLGFVFIFQ